MKSRCILAILSVGYCILAAGCSTPLSATTYPVVTDDGLVGKWALLSVDDGRNDDDREPFLIEITKNEHAAGGLLLSEPTKGRVIEKIVPARLNETTDRPEDARYTISLIGADAPEARDHAPELVAQLLETNRSRLVTFQGSSRETGYPFDVLRTPLQYTLRIERAGDNLKVWAHKHQLVWTPMPIAGASEFDPADLPNEHTRVLVGRFDDVVRYYAAADADAWRIIVTGTRVSATDITHDSEAVSAAHRHPSLSASAEPR